jgi:enoyl-CoA hydratase/carnithine racemase
MQEYQQILYEKSGRVARVTTNRPRYRNAQSRVLLEELDAAFEQAAADPEVRVVVLAGAGEHFSAGHDLGTPEDLEDRERRPYPEGMRGEHQRSWELYVANSLRWRDLPKPTIAQVQGFCIYGGFIIASAMDLIVAADDARFLPAHLQYFTAPWDLGVRKAKEILWEARFIEAEEALALGLVNQVVPRDQLDSATMELAERVAKIDPLMVKFSVNQAQDAMGFRTAVQGAHSNYMVLQSSAGDRSAPRNAKGRPRLPGVERAFQSGEKPRDESGR